MSFRFVHFKCSFVNKILFHCCLGNVYYITCMFDRNNNFIVDSTNSVFQFNTSGLMFAISGYLATDLPLLT